MCRARDLLREVHDQPVSIREVARDAVMSPFHFIRQFQAVFGETPNQFRIQARLDRAKHLLATSERSVTDVCMEVDLTSLGSFSDLFTRRVGASPSVYRQRIRSAMPEPGVLPQELTPGCLTLMGAAFAIFEKQEQAVLEDAHLHENQAHQHHGRRSGEGGEVLHRDLRLREEA